MNLGYKQLNIRCYYVNVLQCEYVKQISLLGYD